MKLSKTIKRGSLKFQANDSFSERYLAAHERHAKMMENRVDHEISRVIGLATRSKRDASGNVSEIRNRRMQRISICREALGEIADLKLKNADLMAEIQDEYDKFIQALAQGQSQYNFIHDHLKKIATNPMTLALLRKRKEELEKKIAILNEKNQKLSAKLLEIRRKNSINHHVGEKNQPVKAIGDNKQEDCNGRGEQQKANYTNMSSVLSAVSLPASTDVNRLTSYSTKLQKKTQQLRTSLRSQYTPKERQMQLENQLKKKENTQHHLLLHNSRLKERFEHLRISMEKLQIGKQQLIKPSTLLQTVNRALENHMGVTTDQSTAQMYAVSGMFEDDDPAKRRDAECLMEYIDTFNEMMNAKEYEQAAKHAANSPKAVLRTFDVMKMFKEIKHEGGTSPLMLFCDALMSTAGSFEPLSGALSCEVIKCALSNQRIDLVSFWISKNCFKLSPPMANVLLEHCSCEKSCTCGSMDLARELFHKLGSYQQAARCLLSSGKINQMIQYGKDHNFNVKDYMFLCKQCPSTDFLLFLMSAHPEVGIPGQISFPYAVNILLESENHNILCDVLKEVHKNGILWIDHSRKYFMDILFNESAEDEMSPEKWFGVVDFCTKQSLNEIAEDLLAALSVRQALDNAVYRCIMDYIS